MNGNKIKIISSFILLAVLLHIISGLRVGHTSIPVSGIEKDKSAFTSQILSQKMVIERQISEGRSEDNWMRGWVYDNSRGEYKIEYSCILEFDSPKGYAEPTKEFLDTLGGYTCNEQRLLTRLAWFESTFNANARNTIYSGYYQISPYMFEWCDELGHVTDSDCALFLFNYNAYQQFEVVSVYEQYFLEFL